jgi:hypothetical protein
VTEGGRISENGRLARIEEDIRTKADKADVARVEQRVDDCDDENDIRFQRTQVRIGKIEACLHRNFERAREDRRKEALFVISVLTGMAVIVTAVSAFV